MLEGFRFGSSPPTVPAPVAPGPQQQQPQTAAMAPYEAAQRPGPGERPADEDAEEDASWHVSESENGSWHVSESEEDGGGSDAGGGGPGDKLEGTFAPSPPVMPTSEEGAGFLGSGGVGDRDDDITAGKRKAIAEAGGRGGARSSKRAHTHVKKAAPRETYRDAVDAERAVSGLGSSKSNGAGARSRFFLPRHHPARASSPPPTPPPHWREVLDAIRTAREHRTASVDDFHDFLLGLRDAPDPHFQALVATLLSVQCRDSVALVAMRRLQFALGGAATLAAVRSVDLAAVEDAVSCCNYKRTKARYVKEAAEQLHVQFQGVVPRSASELQRLPGVGPKIAHLVASVAFGDERSGIVVDTHVRQGGRTHPAGVRNPRGHRGLVLCVKTSTRVVK